MAPQVRVVDTASGPAYLGRKGGCCLAYQLPRAEPDPDEESSQEHRAYLEAFPPEDGPRYCTTCSLRDLTDCENRQVWWLGRRRS